MRKKLINILGGTDNSTVNEIKVDYFNKGDFNGRLDVLISMRNFCDSINGTPADEWCKLVYKHIEDEILSVTE